MRKKNHGLRWTALSFILLYVGVCGFVYIFEDRIVFERKSEDAVFAECTALKGALARSIDGNARFYFKETPQAKATILYFHGNVSGACHYSEQYEALAKLPFHLAFVEYPGYAGDAQTPSQAQILREALKIYDFLATEQKLPVIPFGHSLGTGPATYLASERPVRALLLRAPYDSLISVASYRYPFLPVRLLMKNPFPAIEWAPRVKAPVLILRADRDQTIPPRLTDRQIAAFSKEPQVVEFKNSGHNTMNTVAPGLYWGSVESFIKASL